MITDTPLHRGSDAWLKEMRDMEEEDALLVQAQLALNRRQTDRYSHRSVAEVAREFARLYGCGFVAEIVDGELRVTGVVDEVPSYLREEVA